MNETADKNEHRFDDPDFRNAEKALLRAAKKARERAKRFGHGVIFMKTERL